jgi:hypothetical protein
MKREDYIGLLNISLGNWIIISLIVCCWIIPFCVELTDENSINYILSSISQGLAALFALIFTISLVAAQMSVKYSARMIKGFFSWYITLYMILYFLGIIFPLIGMKIGEEWIVNVSIGLAGTCVILLIPYYFDLRNRLDPEKFLEKLSKKAIEKLENKNEIPEEIKTMENIIIAAFSEKDYDTSKIGIKGMGDILLYSSNKRIHSEAIFDSILIRFEMILNNIIEDRYTFRDVINHLGKISIVLLKRNEMNYHKKIIQTLRVIGSLIIDRQLNYSLEILFDELYNVCKNSIEYYHQYHEFESIDFILDKFNELISYSNEILADDKRVDNSYFSSRLSYLFLLCGICKKKGISTEKIFDIFFSCGDKRNLVRAFLFARDKSSRECIEMDYNNEIWDDYDFYYNSKLK